MSAVQQLEETPPKRLRKGGVLGRRKRQFYSKPAFCGWCKKPVNTRLPPNQIAGKTDWARATIDHIIERSEGGGNEKWNLKVACKRCNEGREIFGGCIGALACASAIYGENATPRQIQDGMMLTGNARKRVTRTLQRIDRRAHQIDNLKILLGSKRPVAIFRPLPTTRILYEGTTAFEEIKGPSHARYKIGRKVKDAGYDAVWYLKFGLVVENPDAFEQTVIQP